MIQGNLDTYKDKIIGQTTGGKFYRHTKCSSGFKPYTTVTCPTMITDLPGYALGGGTYNTKNVVDV